VVAAGKTKRRSGCADALPTGYGPCTEAAQLATHFWPGCANIDETPRRKKDSKRITASSVSEGGASGGGKNVPPQKRNFFRVRRNLP
jgi:hypothetical protein